MGNSYYVLLQTDDGGFPKPALSLENYILKILTGLSPCKLEDCACKPPEFWHSHYGIVSRSLHSGLVNATMIGGAVRTIDSDIDIRIWQALSTRNGSDSVGDYD